MKFVIAIMVIIGVIIILGGMGAMGDAITDFRTDDVSNAFIVTTGVGVTNATVQLSKNLWESSTTYASVVTNSTSDTPAMDSYTDGNRALIVSGLAGNLSRLVTVSYKTGGLTNYAGADTGVRFLPTALILSLIFIPLITVIFLFNNR